MVIQGRLYYVKGSSASFRGRETQAISQSFGGQRIPSSSSAGRHLHPLPRCVRPRLPIKLPPVHDAEDGDEEVDPQRHGQHVERDLDLPFALRPGLLHGGELVRVVGDDAVEALADAPAHHALVVDGPGDDGALPGARVLEEGTGERAGVQGALQHVEGGVRVAEEVAGVGGGEADVGDGKGREVVGAERQVLQGPNAEEDASLPGGVGSGGDGGDGRGEGADDGVRVDVELGGTVRPEELGFHGGHGLP